MRLAALPPSPQPRRLSRRAAVRRRGAALPEARPRGGPELHGQDDDSDRNADLIRLAEAARDRLLRVKGVEKVIISGEIGRTIDVDISTARLAALGISPTDIATALSRDNAVTPGGTIQTPTTEVPIRLDGALDGRAAVAATEIGVNGRTVRLDSIATVARGQEDPPSFLVRHDGVPGVALAVSMQKGTNGLDFGRALREEAASIRADLPTGVTFEQIVDQSQQIAEAVNEFLLKFAVALVVVMLVSFASLGFRVGIIVALSVPLTLSAVFLAMDALGIELQRISLGALILALGLLVDDAIIAIETMAVKANVALLAVLPTMLGAIALVVMVQLQSVRRAVLVVATAPLGIIGAVPALLITSVPFGFVALLGIIALGGMIMRNTLILVDQVRQDRASGLDAHSAVAGSTVRRARPVVLTALAAVLAFVPLAFNVFWGPMAIAMIGGLLAATGLTLVFLPALTAIVLRVPLEPGKGEPLQSRTCLSRLPRPAPPYR